jgi:hypothetical protein
MLQQLITAPAATASCNLCANEAFGEYKGLMLCSEDISQLAKADSSYPDIRTHDRDPICSWAVKGVRHMAPLDPEYEYEGRRD